MNDLYEISHERLLVVVTVQLNQLGQVLVTLLSLCLVSSEQGSCFSPDSS